MRILFTLLLAALASNAMAQEPVLSGEGFTLYKDTTKKINWDSMKRPQQLVDEKPRFNGNINQYLAKNVKVPKGAKLEGRITANFVVDTAGNIGLVTIEGKEKSKLTPLEKEIVRVVSGMPRWIPGKLNGRHVPVKYSLPINLN